MAEHQHADVPDDILDLLYGAGLGAIEVNDFLDHPDPQLAGLSPCDAIKAGRADDVRAFVAGIRHDP